MNKAVMVHVSHSPEEVLEIERALKFAKAFKLFAISSEFIPAYNKIGDSGFDLRANIDETIFLDPGHRVLVKTGVHIQMPVGFELQIRPRSGWALNEGITVVNAPGTIDANYRGEIGVILLNTDHRQCVTIKRGERIAQGVVQRVERIEWNIVQSVTDLTETSRGTTGYGDSGKS